MMYMQHLMAPWLHTGHYQPPRLITNGLPNLVWWYLSDLDIRRGLTTLLVTMVTMLSHLILQGDQLTVTIHILMG